VGGQYFGVLALCAPVNVFADQLAIDIGNADGAYLVGLRYRCDLACADGLSDTHGYDVSVEQGI